MQATRRAADARVSAYEGLFKWQEMNETWAALLGATIGAIAAICAAWLTSLRQEKSEYRKWLREQTQQAYSNALRSLSRATIVPVGTNIDQIGAWFQVLAEVREFLVILQIYSTNEQERIVTASEKLFDVLDKNNFALVATQAATFEQEFGKSTNSVLWEIAEVIPRIADALSEVTKCAQSELIRDLSPA